MTALRDALRERLAARTVLPTLAGLAALHVLLDISAAQLATTAAMGALVGLGDAVEDAYDLQVSLARGSIGLVAVFGGAVLFAVGGGAAWLPTVFLAVGLWLVLDVVQTARHRGVGEADPDGREVYRDYVARRVHETIRERPRTRRELRAELDADAETVDAALDRLRERGVIVEHGSELREAPEPDRWERARDRLSGAAHRIARPITLEFEDSGSDGDGWGAVGPDPAGAEIRPGRDDGRGARSEERRGGERERDAAK